MANSFNCLFLFIPPLLLATYLFSTLPGHPGKPFIHPSLASLPQPSYYTEDFYSGGSYVVLPYGRMRYWLIGPETGRKVVLIHGLSIPSLVWKDVAPKLASEGYRVLMFDLYGRGYTDAPQVRYEATLYTVQLALLMQHINWEKASIIGLSMGGGITAAFVEAFPHLVDDRVVLISSAGIMQGSDLPRTVKFMSSPLIQTLAASLPVQKYLQGLVFSQAATPTEIDPIKEIVRLQSAQLPGYHTALSSSLRDGPIRGQEQAFHSQSFVGRRVLLIHGTLDSTVPYRYASKIQSLLPEGCVSELLTIDGGFHDLTTAYPTVVAEALFKFLA